jgi:hypothetical protein
MLHALAEFLRLDDDLLAVALVSPVPAAGRTAGALLEAARERAG